MKRNLPAARDKQKAELEVLRRVYIKQVNRRMSVLEFCGSTLERKAP